MAVTYTGKKLVVNERAVRILFTGLGVNWADLGDLYLRVYDPRDGVTVLGNHQLSAVDGQPQQARLASTAGVFTVAGDCPIKLYIDDGTNEPYEIACENYIVEVKP